jgi:FKBP-type peptidyl-prolyl cis-trans isomerase
VDRGVRIVEDTPGEGTPVLDGELVTLDLQISLNRGEVVHPRARTTFCAGDRHVFPGLSKSVAGMRRGGYRKTRVGAHLAYGAVGVPEKIPPQAVLICEIWVHDSRATSPVI